MKAIFYQFNSNTQETKVTPCTLEQAHALYNQAREEIQGNTSKYTYFDITVNGRLLRACKI